MHAGAFIAMSVIAISIGRYASRQFSQSMVKECIERWQTNQVEAKLALKAASIES
jgi:hypothetical protein